jgi:tight adherence protein B
MTVLIYVVNPEYVSKLFIDPRGHVLIGFGLGSISCGALVMGRMIRFEI